MRINELKIYSPRLKEQSTFYANALGLKCIKMNKEQASFQLGSSVLTIEYKKETTPYHFAINIPSNKENEALSWLKARLEILIEEEIEIHDFDFWNAKAIYFYDCDKNIVELIARKNLNNGNSETFNQEQLLNISEIGLPTTNIEAKFSQLHELSGIQEFSGGFDRFLAFGDEEGLFICINKDIKDWHPTGDKAHSSAFEMHFTEKGVNYHIEYKNDQVLVLGA